MLGHCFCLNGLSFVTVKSDFQLKRRGKQRKSGTTNFLLSQWFGSCIHHLHHVATPSYKSITMEDEKTDFGGELTVFHGSYSRPQFLCLNRHLFTYNILGFCDTKCPQLYKPGFWVYLLLLSYHVTGTKFVLKQRRFFILFITCFLLMRVHYWVNRISGVKCKIKETKWARLLYRRKRRDLGVWREDPRGCKTDCDQAVLTRLPEKRLRRKRRYQESRDECGERTELVNGDFY